MPYRRLQGVMAKVEPGVELASLVNPGTVAVNEPLNVPRRDLRLSGRAIERGWRLADHVKDKATGEWKPTPN